MQPRHLELWSLSDALSVLAREIYPVLRPRVPAVNPRISYTELVGALPVLGPPNENPQVRDPRLDRAIGELCRACRRRGLPAISAIVVHHTEARDGMSGPGYYPEAHPEVGNDRERQQIAWHAEYEAARNTTYPENLDE